MSRTKEIKIQKKQRSSRNREEERDRRKTQDEYGCLKNLINGEEVKCRKYIDVHKFIQLQFNCRGIEPGIEIKKISERSTKNSNKQSTCAIDKQRVKIQKKKKSVISASL